MACGEQTANCPVTPIDDVVLSINDVTLDVVKKFKELSNAVLDRDGIYSRAKDTLFAYFKQLDITDKEKAAFGAQFMASFTTQTVDRALQIAEKWANDEATLPYELSKLEIDAKKAMADYEIAVKSACIADAEVSIKCEQIELEREKVRGEQMKNDCLYSPGTGTVCREMTLKENQWSEGNKAYVVAQTDLVTAQKLTEDGTRQPRIGEITAAGCLKQTQASDIANQSGYKTSLQQAQATLAMAQVKGIGVSWANAANSANASVYSTSMTVDLGPTELPLQEPKNIDATAPSGSPIGVSCPT